MPDAALTLVLLLLAAQPGPVETVVAFRDARDRGDLEAARRFLTDDPRVWYERHEGRGAPLVLGAGKWSAWDIEFHSRDEIGEWTVEGDTVWAVAVEDNDYYRLLERKGVSRYRITYFLDAAGKIEGSMISAADPGRPDEPPDDRFEEFRAWAVAQDPREWDYLHPNGKLDPTGDRARRTRRLLERWRASVGLE